MAFANFANIPKVPELRKRLLFTLFMLAIYRVGVFITAPGIDRNVMRSVVQRQSGGLLGMFNLFTGGALENLSIFALGIMPYISSSIIMQLLGTVYKPIDDMRREGEQGRRKLDQYTRYGTVVLSIFQSFGIAMYLEGLNHHEMGGSGGMGDVVANPGWAFRLMTIITLTTGTAFIMWVGEQITERGVSNGISLIIFAGILSDLPSVAVGYVQQHEGNLQPLTIASMLALIVGTVAVVVFFERAQRRIPIVYSRRQVGRRVYGGQTAHLPLKVNSASMIPAIFASSLLMFPATLANLNIPGMNNIQAVLNKGGWVFNTFYALLIIFFCFFYTAVTVRPVDIAENLKKQQANVPGIRPGKQTAEYIDRVLTRITLGGSLYVAAVCLIPNIASAWYNVSFRFGGTSIMIVVGVALDLSSSIESHLITHNYEGLTGPKVSRIRGRQV
ncbi:MAG TPA: preprotein translocase subunit SecY [Polyangiaceae bacterium]|jgi:preprotein translocase subunit SecY|nr:MAG: preprotein translocase subunit SecY [Deltaproteobacteria bacterium ADurb.Bin207]HNS95438.1 preprotein translocase subunit SecY [Polyangiaceae bacterium]HNZ20622.1 preprotein translocase subunit SecY [Polyangiaceae bacterium]HOD20762.1 preprotein translocase subunit SecY [Polyangiaceae bacterium]HOE47182.1 preprotein translocase subunit SecY [Polyangiaceae bacterium]